MKQLAYSLIGMGLALGFAPAVLAADDVRADRHDTRHERLEERHADTHDRLEDKHAREHDEGLSRREHSRLHDKLERKHDRADRRIEQRHDAQHGRDYGYGDRGYGYDNRGYGYGRSDGYGGYGYDRGYDRYALRGEGWSRLGWIARDPRLASWVLDNFDRNRNGSLGAQEAQLAEREIYRMADRNRDGRLSERELSYWQSYAARY